MAADINKPKIRDKSVKLLRKKPKIHVNKAWICRHITKYYEIFKDNDESMYTSSGSIIATTVNFDQPFDVCRQSFHHYVFGLILKNKMAAKGISLSVMKSAYISLIIGPRGLGW